MRVGIETIAAFCGVLLTVPPWMVQEPSTSAHGTLQTLVPTATASPIPPTPLSQVSEPTVRFDIRGEVRGTAQNVVFTLALGNEARTNAQIAVEMARLLKSPPLFSPYWFGQNGAAKGSWSPTSSSIIIPEGSWTLRSFVDQCRADDHVKGAFIALPAAIETESISRFLSARTVKILSFAVVVVECRKVSPVEASPPEATRREAYIIAALGVNTGVAESTVYSLVPFALGVALYSLLAPSRTNQVTRTQVFPTTPIPPTGTISQIVTQTTVANGASNGNLSASFLTLFSGQYSNAVTLSTGTTSADSLTGDAIRRALVDVDRELHDACAKKQDDPTRPAFCDW